ncbi:MAG: metallophosphoesterase family protein [Desulfotomaculales bacterium]
MRLVVLSDTHVRRRGERLPPVVEKALEDAGLIVHCGDFEIYAAYEELKKTGRLVAVHGNMDSPDLKGELPEKAVFTVEGIKIGVIHGGGPPWGIEKRVAAALPGVDVVLYGHSHRPQNEVKGGVLFFNPGSPTDRRFAPFNSYGIIEIGPDGPRGEIVRL